MWVVWVIIKTTGLSLRKSQRRGIVPLTKAVIARCSSAAEKNFKSIEESYLAEDISQMKKETKYKKFVAMEK